LTLEDVLHPQEGDAIVASDLHADDCTYLRYVIKDRHTADLSVVVLSDCDIFWDIPGLKHHRPDLAVIFGVKRRKDWPSFDVNVEKVRPSLIVEVSSPATRVVDVDYKVKEYAQARVPHYVIADVDDSTGRRRITLKAYRLKRKRWEYKPVKLNERGWAWLEPVQLWLGVKVEATTGGDRLALIDPKTELEIGDYTAVRQEREVEAEARAAAEARATEAEARATKAETRATKAETRAATETQARAAAEAHLRQVEAELRRLKGRKG
jgi:Uma2 family endonuclease